MENIQELTRRVDELEIKASFADDMLEQLNQVILRQQREIDGLARQLADMRQQVDQAGAGTTLASLRDEIPPHY
ncbi:SlyX family protein [Achromobacter aloeverae]|uniref:SlyX protein n=1 Tax=Achromobacter aloeverae TaxID=1750518 RepID=A0A4Q1HMF1_9BURK|nr:SlyX family protein [Achromobacter aloeverae]RXN91456.1 SlyX protein [Achromobacter aloeverae]